MRVGLNQLLVVASDVDSAALYQIDAPVMPGAVVTVPPLSCCPP
jgi:hypothetical protein